MKARPPWFEFLMVFLLVAGVAALSEVGRLVPPGSKGPEALRSAPGFVLADVQGGRAAYRRGDGPLLLLLTSSSCGQCVRRGEIDSRAGDLARRHGVPAWSILAWTVDDEEADALLRTSGQRADRYLLDPDASVTRAGFAGGDESCWVLIGPRGEVAWQGPANLEALEAALAGFAPDGPGGLPGGPRRLWHDS